MACRRGSVASVKAESRRRRKRSQADLGRARRGKRKAVESCGETVTCHSGLPEVCCAALRCAVPG
jgi:hypothetical protein